MRQIFLFALVVCCVSSQLTFTNNLDVNVKSPPQNEVEFVCPMTFHGTLQGQTYEFYELSSHCEAGYISTVISTFIMSSATVPYKIRLFPDTDNLSKWTTGTTGWTCINTDCEEIKYNRTALTLGFAPEDALNPILLIQGTSTAPVDYVIELRAMGTDCGVLTTCASCQEADACGWCAYGNGDCVAGFSSPRYGCPAQYFLKETCQMPQCADYTACYGCTGDARCGWCEDTFKCQEGTSAGSTEGCPATHWFFSQDSCSAASCAHYTSCDACTGDRGCGWCASTGTCQRGTATGPTSGTCPVWEFAKAQCTNYCGSFTDCTACIFPSDRCAWCSQSHTCVNLTSSACPAESRHTASCPSACTQGSCSACTADAGCGWCNGLTCVAGNARGPTGNTTVCTSYVYALSQCAAPGGLSVGATLGIIIGVILVICGVVFGFFVWRCLCKKSKGAITLADLAASSTPNASLLEAQENPQAEYMPPPASRPPRTEDAI